MTLGAWLRAQGKLMGVTFLILTAGFFFLRVEYALLFALLITIIDALPVFGTSSERACAAGTGHSHQSV